MKKIIYSTLVISSSVILLLYGCKKPDETAVTDDKDVATATDNMVAQKGVQDAASVAQEATSGSVAGRFAGGDSCAVITKDSVAKTIDITFAGCTGKAHYRIGKIHVSYTDDYKVIGAVQTITFVSGYKFENNTLTGTITVTTEANNSYHVVFTELKSGVIDNGKSYTSIIKNFDRHLRFVDTKSTPGVRSDDDLFVTGFSSGTDRNGKACSDSIATELHFSPTACPKPRFMAGDITFKIAGKANRTIHYSEDCDDKGTKIKIGNNITLDYKQN